jgi:hypothetical protein
MNRILRRISWVIVAAALIEHAAVHLSNGNYRVAGIYAAILLLFIRWVPFTSHEQTRRLNREVAR